MKSDKDGGNPYVDYTLDYISSYFNELMRYNQFVDLVNKTYNKEIRAELYKINNNIDKYVSKMNKSINMNYIRWNYILTGDKKKMANQENYMSEVRNLKAWVSRRLAYMDKRYKQSNVEYRTHVQDIGNTALVKDGSMSGTTGQSLRMESIKIIAPSELADAHINYQAHVENIGWMPWVSDGELAGTQGQGLRMEALRINLTGIPNYEVTYRVHVENIGWQGWKYSGEVAGTEGQSLRIEAIEIKVIRRDFLGSSNSPKTTSNINYIGHIQNIGWSRYGSDGETIGTQDKSYRLEALKIKVNNDLIPNTNISYQAHVENIGWKSWVKNGEIAGTEGQSLRLEAIKIKLDNPNYSVKYRAYVENIGWMSWVKDGEIAGTTGKSLRIEAIEIKIEKNT